MRILVVSDVHANLNALNTVIDHAGAFDQIWSLGDVIDYGPQPNECIDRLREFDWVAIAGNHDYAVLDKIDLEDFNPDAARAALWTRDQLTPANFAWLQNLPERIRVSDDFTLVHGSPEHPIWEYILDVHTATRGFHLFDTSICLFGHTHLPTLFRLGQTVTQEFLPEASPVHWTTDRLMINPGSVGQPRDQDSRAAYAMIDTQAMALTHYRVEYDIAATQKKMEQADLPERLIWRLSFGR
jgi:predicted phosphodiesterase